MVLAFSVWLTTFRVRLYIRLSLILNKTFDHDLHMQSVFGTVKCVSQLCLLNYCTIALAACNSWSRVRNFSRGLPRARPRACSSASICLHCSNETI